MGKKYACWFAVLFSTCAIRAQEPVKTPAIQEVWEAASLENGRAGWFSTTFQTLDVEGQKVIRTRMSLNLNVKRFSEVVRLRMQSGTDETPEGKVVGVYMRMEQASGPLILEGNVKEREKETPEGTVKERYLAVEIDKGRIKRELPWSDKILGQHAQEQFFKNNKFKPGDKFTYLSFEPSLNTIVTIRASVHEEEEVELLGKKRSLFKAIIASDKIEVPGASVQLPPIALWMDEKGNIFRRQVEIPGLGKIVLVRTTKEIAQTEGKVAEFTDIGLKHLIYVNRNIGRPNDTVKAVYRITIKDDASPETALVQDARQKVQKGEGSAIELHVKAIRNAPSEGDDKAKDEFLKTCHFIDSEDARIQALAKDAVGDEEDPWFKARRIEGWVHRKMRLDNTIAFGPASEVAKGLRGDCRQHALLAAAMCRAVGVPSRTAIGLVYAEDRQGKGMFAFHMWFEVWVRGQWLALDATRGEGAIGASHIKVTDHSWYDTQSLTPLLPLQRVLGKMKVEVVSFSH